MAFKTSDGGGRMKPPGDRKRQVVQIGALLRGVVEPTLAARGLGQMSLIADWPDIVGADVARYAQPAQMQWPPRGARQDPNSVAPATLVLRVDPAFALEAQHAAPIIVQRVNAHLGWRCVDRIAFRQGPLAPVRPRRRAAPVPSDAARAQAAALAAPIADDELRQALARLGAAAIDKEARRRRREPG